MYENIKSKIKEIVDICDQVPEPYREKCFELLVSPLINNARPQPSSPVDAVEPSSKPNLSEQANTQSFRLPFEVKAFLTQYDIPEEHLNKLFYIEGDQIKPIYELKTTKRTRGQIQLSLLAALENALKGRKFEFSIEEVRSRCNDHKCYDATNFNSYFKKRAKLFKSLDGDENIELSPDGKEQLSDTIFDILKNEG